MNASKRTRSATRIARWVLRASLVAWAGFWAWFVATATVGEWGTVPWWIPTAWLASLSGLVFLGWRHPLVGGLALVVVGAWAAVYFHNPWARALLAAPAVALGIGCITSSVSARWLASTAALLCCLASSACMVAQDPADLPFRTSSILRHDNGQMKRAYLCTPTQLEGLPSQRWAWWHDDGSIDNVELAQDVVVQEHAFPRGTRVFFDRDGRLAHAWLAHDVHVDGRSCRGGMKIDTAFHANGRVRAFFPREATEIDGVVCTASLFHPVYLHPDGRLAQCKLARDAAIDGRTFAQGTVLSLDAAGHPRR